MKFPGFHNPWGAQVNSSDGASVCRGRTRDKDKGTTGSAECRTKGQEMLLVSAHCVIPGSTAMRKGY